ncbi:diguanylate cyclase domain-containing protein [Halarsenatibacter silvermanii]|uniref:PAS domain S-box-containing protein/diguanylate cyclase (GGDEF) domain-containing protein n=1 Tax=Halarsenatibacter silvermanii TaxID=321763 RepID=A0A1G9RK03_9FIRM|nr:diguanylate cyclase [Halarsenatibacter silvermanii]SDM23481.1 PAS domain S-box-containing protein/diguanylate cyclase (GGDEF) domain-containing protein [Halarsenatibacter silvermanii]
MKDTQKARPESESRAKINLLISNYKNRELLENQLEQTYELYSDSDAPFQEYELVILDENSFENYRFQLRRLKEDDESFTPVICLQEENQTPARNLLELADDVIKLPVSRSLLQARIKNMIKNKKLWAERKILEDRYRSIFHNINDMVFMVETLPGEQPGFKISEVNDKLQRKLEFSPEELKGFSPGKLIRGEQVDDLFEMIGDQKEALFTADLYTGEEETMPAEISAREVRIHDKKQILCSARDVTEKKQKEEKINYLLIHDDLTGLYNRKFFEEELKRLNTGRQLPLCVFIIDINGMKLVNDSYGHNTGDELLIKTADLLQDIFRAEDILARWGGDEFSVLLPQTTEEEAEKILDRIKRACQQTENDKLPVSLGAGYAVKKDESADIFDIIHEADSRMYQDKLTSEKSATNKIVASLLSTLETKSPETEAHTHRLTALAMRFGEKIGLSNNQLDNLSLLATLHDVGKVHISEKILSKPDDLDDEEWQTIKEHPRTGYKIALSCSDFSSVADEILSHHERWDGRGYPQKLEKDKIPLLSRIISIVDAYDVMTNERPYSKPLSCQAALEEIKECAGEQFDPDLAEKFIEMMTENNLCSKPEG